MDVVNYTTQRHQNRSYAVKRTINIDVPAMLTKEYWDRYELSREDIHRILDAFPDDILFKLCIYYGTTPPVSTIKVSFTDVRTMLYERRFKVRSRIIDRVALPERSSKMNPEKCNHTPNLPFISVDADTYRAAYMSVPTDWNPMNNHSWSWVWTYDEQKYVAISFSEYAVCVHRITPSDSYKYGTSAITRAPQAIVKSKLYAITEEACWLAVE